MRWWILGLGVLIVAGVSMARAEAGKPLVVVARLVDAGKPVPHCGRMHYVVVMRYEVRRVIEGEYVGQDLFVAQSCPEMGHGPSGAAVKPFKVGETYRLTLAPRRGQEGALVDAFTEHKQPRFVASRIEVEPAPAK